MISIVVVDNHRIVRQGICALLSAEPGFTVVGEADNGPEALSQVGSLRPDVLVTDLTMEGMSGIEVVKRARTVAPNTR